METIFGIGVDQVEAERVIKACEKETFLRKFYTENEHDLIQIRKTRCATNFAGKEAVAKALGTGFGKVLPKEVEILRNELGAPFVCLHGAAKAYAKEHGITKIHLSLTDTKQDAVAYAIAICER